MVESIDQREGDGGSGRVAGSFQNHRRLLQGNAQALEGGVDYSDVGLVGDDEGYVVDVHPRLSEGVGGSSFEC